MSNEENKNVSDVVAESAEENLNSIEKDENENTEVKEEVETAEEEKPAENPVEEKAEEKEEDKAVEEKAPEEKSYSSKVPFLANIEALVIDQFICVILAIALLYLSKLILGALGYYILDTTSMLFYMYVAVTILYPCIIECTKLGATVGRKVCDLKLIKL